MALKDTWVDKLDGIDDVLASDINSIAQSAISLEGNTEKLGKKVDELGEKLENQDAPTIELAQTLDGFTEEEAKSKAPSVKAAKEYVSSVTKSFATNKYVDDKVSG